MGVTIPLDEFGKEARAIKVRVIQVGAIVLIFAVLGVTLLAYYLLRPVRRLADRLSRSLTSTRAELSARRRAHSATRFR